MAKQPKKTGGIHQIHRGLEHAHLTHWILERLGLLEPLVGGWRGAVGGLGSSFVTIGGVFDGLKPTECLVLGLATFVLILLAWERFWPKPLRFDAVEDFSIADNPSGPWHYGHTLTLKMDDFILHRTIQHDDFKGTERWQDTEVDSVISVMHNKTRKMVVARPNKPDERATYVIPSDMLHMHPGLDPRGKSVYDVVRWQCPRNATYLVYGAFHGLDINFMYADPEVYIILTDRTGGHKLHEAHLTGYCSQYPFEFRQPFWAGDTLDFVVGQGQRFGADSVGLQLWIDEVKDSSKLPKN